MATLYKHFLAAIGGTTAKAMLAHIKTPVSNTQQHAFLASEAGCSSSELLKFLQGTSTKNKTIGSFLASAVGCSEKDLKSYIASPA